MLTATSAANHLGPALLKGLDLLWQYREAAAIILGLILLVMIVDNLAAIHRELEHLRKAIEASPRTPRNESMQTGDLTLESEGWRAD